MKTIIAATDFSSQSVNAVNYAADLCCATGKNLLLVHVCAVPLSFSELPDLPFGIEELKKDSAKKLAQLRLNILERTMERISVKCKVLQGDIVPAIQEQANTTKPYAVVMGPESADTFDRFLGTGTAVAALSHLHWPLILIPENAAFKTLRNIGLACDLKDVITTIPLKEIKSLVRDFHARLHVAHIDTRKKADEIALTEEATSLKVILKEFRPRYHLFKNTDFEKSIQEFIDIFRLDMLIVLPKKHQTIGRLFRHSRSRQAALHATIPVLAVHE